MKSWFAKIGLAVLIISFYVPHALAQIKVEVPPINPIKEEKIYLPGAANPDSEQKDYVFKTFLPNATSLVISLTGGLSLLFVIISGIQILTSYNNEDRIGAAKKTLTWALLGFAISLLSYGIVQIIVSIDLS